MEKKINQILENQATTFIVLLEVHGKSLPKEVLKFMDDGMKKTSDILNPASEEESKAMDKERDVFMSKGCGKEFNYDDGMPMTCGMELDGRKFFCDDCQKKEGNE